MADTTVIESLEYYDYKPPLSENINEAGTTFPIICYNEDITTLPHKSLLVINGKITVKNDKGEPLTSEIDPTKIDFVNNGILNLFDRIDYYVGDAKIDSIRKPAISTTLKGYVSFKHNREYHSAGWYNEGKGGFITKEGHFSFTILLSIIMGFFEDYTQFLYRMAQKLILYKTTANDANCLISATGYTSPVITLNEIVWRVPQVKFSIAYETQVRKQILSNKNFEMRYRHWLYHTIVCPTATDFTWDIPVAYAKTKYILIAFQTDRGNNIKKNNSEFDSVKLENVQVLLNNNVYYPRERLNLAFDQRKCGNLYHMFKTFKEVYYGGGDTLPLIDYNTFLEKVPIVAIDCSHQPTVIKESLINIKVMFNWQTNVAASTVIHCVTIMDRQAVYNPLNNRVVGI